MKNLKFLFVAVILTCSVCVIQTKAQAHIEQGTEYKPLIYEVDGEQYLGIAYVEYQWVGTPSGRFSWIAHGHLISASINDGQGVSLDPIPLPKRTVNATDACMCWDEKVKINPKGKVTVVAHEEVDIWW